MQPLPVAFDKHWRAHSPRMRSCVTRLSDLLLASEQRKRRRALKAEKRFIKAVEVLLCNLAAVALAEPSAALQVPVTLEAAGHGMPHALKGLHKLGLVVLERDRRAFTRHGPRRFSTATATSLLQGHLPSALSWRDVRLTFGQGAPSLVLHSEKDQNKRARRVRWAHTSETRHMTTSVQQVNRYLTALPVTFDDEQAWLLPARNGFLRSLYTPQHSRCVRIFNNGTFEHGGRLYGGWWLAMPKAERRSHIRLAGEVVTHCDYNTLYLRLAYAHFDMPWPFTPAQDAYSAGSVGNRDAWKACTSALLFRKRKLKQLPNSARGAFDGMTPTDVYNAIREKHAPLAAAGAFNTGLGHMLARKESDLMIVLLLRLKAQGIPALPIHDCLLAPASQAQAVAEFMRSTAQEQLGCELPVSI